MDRQTPGPSKRLERAKNKLTPTRSAEFLRTEFRQRFLSRVKLLRSKNFDRLRQILEDVEEQTPYKSTDELKTKLLENPEANYLMSDSEVNSIMEEIEMELNVNDFEMEASHYGKFSEMETADIIERHLSPCTMCERGNIDGAMCSPCRKSLYSQFKG